MKILITGANGQVAFELQQKFPVISFSKEQLDISNQDQVMDIIASQKPDIVINAAAYTQVDKAENDVDKAFSVNRDGAKHLAIACEKHASALIHLSTDYVFDGQKNAPYLESDPVSPINVYGQSKWAGEEAIRHYHPNHLIIRVSGVFGTHGHNFVKTILRLTKEKKALRIVSDQILCPTPAKAIASMLEVLCQKIATHPAWGTYHYGGSPEASWFQLAKCIAGNHVMIEPIFTKDYVTPAKRPLYSVLNCQKIKTIFDIQQPDWKEGLNDVLSALQL